MVDPKTPEEIKLYGIKFRFRSNQTAIATAAWTVPAGLTRVSSSVEGGDTALVMLSGGTLGQTYYPTVRVVTNDGQELDDVLEIRVQSAKERAGLSA